jgi:hypothetical protein
MALDRAILHACWRMAMKHEDIIASEVTLAAPLIVNDIKNTRKTLTTIGDAARFIRSNFSRLRSNNLDWEHAAKTLEVAAETNDSERRQHATDAVIALLRADGMLVAKSPPADVNEKKSSPILTGQLILGANDHACMGFKNYQSATSRETNSDR